MFEWSLDRALSTVLKHTSLGTLESSYGVHEGVASGYLQGSKSHTIVKTLKMQEYLDFETMKNFLMGDGLGKFSKSTSRSM